MAGYFASIAGIDKAFLGAPSEATPFFTYRSEPLHFQTLPNDVDTGITLLDAGKWHIYYNPNPAGSWNDPSSFSQGQVVADLTHNALQIVTSGPAHAAVFSGELLASYDFVFGEKTLNFANFFPNGITNFSFATNTVVPGPQEFPVTFADAGWAVAKGHTPGNRARTKLGKEEWPLGIWESSRPLVRNSAVERPSVLGRNGDAKEAE